MSERERQWVPRLLLNRIVRRPPDAVGACDKCGVAFAGLTERWGAVEQVLRAHESICPGGQRWGEVVRPFHDNHDTPLMPSAILP